jgi:uncharacterized RDD family membrane protein YckC
VATAIASSVPWAAARPIYGPAGINFLRPIWLFAIPLIFICISFGYHAVAVARYGTTFGKRLFKIQIRSITGSSVDFRQSFIRTAVSWVSLLLLGLGYLMMFFNEHRRTLHDFASGTLAAHNRITKIGIGTRITPRPLPHHPACGSAPGDSISRTDLLPRQSTDSPAPPA